MKWPTWLRNLWWLIITAFLTFIVLARIIFGSGDQCESWKIVLLIIWFGMIIAPIFSEINLFGFKLKQELKELKDDVNKNISTLKADVQTTILNQVMIANIPESKLISVEQAESLKVTPPKEPKYSHTEYMILNTLWAQQVNYYPDYSGVWTFKIHANTPVFLAFREAGIRLLRDGLISETNEGQYYLTKQGFNYCKDHYKEFPPDRWYAEVSIDPEKLKIALGEKEKN